MAKPTLDDLRAIFREEFDDLLHVLGRQADRAERGMTPEDAGSAAAEVRRAVHTMKGAARAVGYAVLEAECHRLETAMEQMRAAGPPSPAEVVKAAREAITVVSRFTTLVHGDSPPSVESPPSTVRTVPTSLEASEAPQAPPEAEHATSLGASGQVFAHDTVRVDAAGLAGILDASENLVLEMARSRSAVVASMV